jgi:hypothetical protein
MAVQDQKKKLMERQQLELQKQHVKEMLEIEKSNETDKERIAELEEEMDMLQDTVNALSQKERNANDLLEDARKVAVTVSYCCFLCICFTSLLQHSSCLLC